MDERQPYATTPRIVIDMILSTINQTQKNILCMIPLYKFRKNKAIVNRDLNDGYLLGRGILTKTRAR